MRHHLLTLFGGLVFLCLVLRHRSVYRGTTAFYAISQREAGLLNEAALALFASPPAQMAVNHERFKSAVQRDRLSPMAVEQYSDDSLSGYGDLDFGKGGVAFDEQQRTAIVPLLNRSLAQLPSGAVVVEIGTGNGDVIANVAREHPDLDTIGVDFSVRNAVSKHGDVENLRFIAGYALELLEQDALRGTVVFASSTFIVFTPLELRAYVRELRRNGFREVVLSEPTWGGYVQHDNHERFSRHLEGATWHHNYAGYLREGGYEICDFSFEPYAPPGSNRPDTRLLLIRARLAQS